MTFSSLDVFQAHKNVAFFIFVHLCAFCAFLCFLCVWNLCVKKKKKFKTALMISFTLLLILSPNRGLLKMSFSPLTMPSPWMIFRRYSIIYQPWKIQNNIINIGGAINLQVNHVYTDTHRRQLIWSFLIKPQIVDQYFSSANRFFAPFCALS